ncbi:hypothetical protein HY642_00770 [Candidatus Woesearchaeota archaeon]|nr:hypothetical protein [Candidatus Woesearchaeota archaeon]
MKITPILAKIAYTKNLDAITVCCVVFLYKILFPISAIQSAAKQTFAFLKKALQRVEASRPFRGPRYFVDGDFEYVDESEGDITRFKGIERIFFKGKEVFSQDYIGGLIVHKS